jgi:dUTP pyrophosphatase
MSFSEVPVPVKRLPHGSDLPLPQYETDGAAGLDLQAAIPAGDELILAPGKRDMVPTGLSMALPLGYEAQIRPRSGLAAKNGVTALNSPGTIDCDYRGEVKVILINHGQEPLVITRGMRIAQMVIAPVTRGIFEEHDSLPDTDRGAGGFGSTGTGGS